MTSQSKNSQLQSGNTINKIVSQIIFQDRSADSNPSIDMFNDRWLFDNATNNSGE